VFGLTLTNIAEIVQGKLTGGSGNIEPVGAAIDTRCIGEKELFFALKGEKADGHDFLTEARDRGAMAAIVSHRPSEYTDIGFPLIIVENVTKAMQQIALAMRRRFGGPVIAITGSTGKTTTKDMLWSVLRERGPVLKNKGNYNNELGLPLTLLALQKEHWAIVLEMGMRGMGEIDFLARHSEPGYGVITSIGHTHQELLGTVEKIAQAKAELISHIPYNGGLVLNISDKDRLKPWLSNIRSEVCWVGLQRPAQLWAEEISETGESLTDPVLEFMICTIKGKEAVIKMPVLGRHNVINALLAAGIARQLGLKWEEIEAGLEKVSLSARRLELKEVRERDIMIIDDAYNANPESVAAALDTLVTLKSGQDRKRAVAVLGNMYELGSYEEEGHRLVGEKAQKAGVSFLITVGQLACDIAVGALSAGMDATQIRTCQNNSEAIACLKEMLKAGDLVLIKGSRGVKMEEIVFGLLTW